MIKRAFLGVAFFISIAPVQAQQSVRPGINNHYEDADADRWQGVFERDGREVWDRRRQIVAALDLQHGEVVADIGAGTGFFVLMFAQAVGPQGRVYAVDITPNFVDSIRRRARESGLDNITGVVNSPRSAALPPRSIDLVFTSDTYHHFEYPQSMLASIYAALKSEGELVVIDFMRTSGVSRPWVIKHVRVGEADVVTEIEQAGFELVDRETFMETRYFLRFRKRAENGGTPK